jgi:hypothetical protein
MVGLAIFVAPPKLPADSLSTTLTTAVQQHRGESLPVLVIISSWFD